MAITAHVRLLVLTVLVGLATAAVGAPATQPAVRSAPAEPGNPRLALAVLIALALPAVGLIIVAAVRSHRPRRRPPRQRSRGDALKPLAGALVLLGLLAIAVLGTVLAARFAGERSTGEEPSAPSPSPAPDPAAPGDTADAGWLIVAAAVLIALLVLAAVGYRRSVAPEPAGAAPQRSLARAVERGLSAVLEPARDARTAIIRCYAAMEAGLTAVPALAPHAADSPSEVLHRAHRVGAVRSPTTWRLVELFDEARFSAHPMTEPDRADAEASLRVLLDELGRPR